MTLDITVTDLFCGAGGSSIGAEAAGARLRMAANHWPLAIETHNTNFPDADHDCADVSQVNPRRYPHTDILIASPECTNHSSANSSKGKATIWDPYGDAESERSRATMWDVPRFAEAHRYQIVIVENVVEAIRWAPYDSWLMSMTSLGYEYRQVFLNSMVAHPTPQSRDRLYVIFWRKGNKAPDLDIRPLAYCEEHGDVHAIQSWKKPRAVGKYRSQYVYRCPTCAKVALPYAWPAAAAIDWSLEAPRIGDRNRPLAPATMRRIQAGIDRYGSAIVQAAGHTFERPGYHRTWPLWQPIQTQTTTIQHGIVVDTAYAHAQHAQKTRPTTDALPTQTAQQTQGLVVPMMTGAKARPSTDPLGTVVATSSVHGLLVPAGGTWNDEARPVQEPFRTRTGVESEGLVVTMRGTSESAVDAASTPTGEPLRTISAGGVHHGLLVRGYSGGAEMSKPTDHPVDTITAHDHHALLMPYNSTGPANPVDEPHRTMDTRDRYGLIEPSIDIMDCGFRMLEPHEIGRAMAFPETYVVHGNKRERVRQYGNAVTPPVMNILLRQCIQSLA